MLTFALPSELQNDIIEAANSCIEFRLWESSTNANTVSYAQQLMQHHSDLAFALSKAYLELVGSVDSEPR